MAKVVELTCEGATMRIVPGLGGRVSRLRLVSASGPRDVLVDFPEEAELADLARWPKGGIYPLVPYGNRIRNARLRFEGTDHRLRPHPDAAPHTLHGHGHRAAWTLDEATSCTAAWSLRHRSDEEWPWAFTARMDAWLGASEVRLTLAVRNDDRRPMPAGLGLHPYFLCDAGDVLRFRAARDWPATTDYLAGPPRDAAPDHAEGAQLPEDTVTLYRSAWDDAATLRRGTGAVLRLTADPVFDHLVVHRPSGAAYLCLEPATHAPDGFNAAEAGMAEAGRRVLAPGETLSGEVAIALEGATDRA